MKVSHLQAGQYFKQKPVGHTPIMSSLSNNDYLCIANNVRFVFLLLHNEPSVQHQAGQYSVAGASAAGPIIPYVGSGYVWW